MMPIIVSILGVATASAQILEQQPPLSVCELIAHRTEYNGRLITVRGEAKSGGHGAWLTASSECQYRLITKGVTWPNDIFLAYPDNKSLAEGYHAPFQVDWKSVQRAEEIVKHSGFNPDTDHLIETYVGRFVTYQDLESRGNPPSLGGRLGFGFGPIGLDAPAQLLIKSVKDVVVFPRKR